MFLAVDVGNTKTAFALYAPDGGARVLSWRLATDPRRTADEVGLLCRQALQARGQDSAQIRSAGVVSVVPTLEKVLATALVSWLGVSPTFVTAESQSVIRVDYDRPSDLGPDRAVNGAYAFVRHGGPVLVVDAGTAVTLDLVSVDGVFRGGAILPGQEAFAEVLSRRGARLPRIPVTAPVGPIGCSTAECLRAGLHYGFRYAVRGLVENYRQSFPGGLKVVLTGGSAESLVEAVPAPVTVDPDLTLDGVRYLVEMKRWSEGERSSSALSPAAP